MSNYSNSPLVVYTKLSPNHSGIRNHVIDTISIHCMAGNCSVETCGQIFAPKSAGASSNYGIGSDGRIAMYVEEKNRSWCTSSASNDNRAVTIEVANITGPPDYKISDKAYESLIKLCADICRRNNIKGLLWKGDKSLIGQVDKQNMTVHRWFKAKACPGDYLYGLHGKISADVNKLLNSNSIISNNDIVSKSNEEIMWDFLKNKGLNDYAIAGIMGNIYAESGLHSNNLQNTFEKKLGYTDDTYTKAVDNNSYKNFVKDSAGYGLAQWTYWSRKEGLLNYAKKVNKSIGDMSMQLEYLWTEFQSYKEMLNILKYASSIREASDAVLLNFEKPADQSESVRVRRSGYGQTFYDRFCNKSNLPYKVRVTTDSLNIRKGPGSNYQINGTIKDRGVYTIIEESSGVGSKLWGKLKSGTGWISLDYAKKI